MSLTWSSNVCVPLADVFRSGEVWRVYCCPDVLHVVLLGKNAAHHLHLECTAHICCHACDLHLECTAHVCWHVHDLHLERTARFCWPAHNFRAECTAHFFCPLGGPKGGAQAFWNTGEGQAVHSVCRYRLPYCRMPCSGQNRSHLRRLGTWTQSATACQTWRPS
eukprot:jgi/Botrbrau1/20975/Bobra.0756s0004.1